MVAFNSFFHLTVAMTSENIADMRPYLRSLVKTIM